MQDFLIRLRQSASTKVAVIGLLILVLLIPLAMINGVIAERDRTGRSAVSEVQRTWGGAQFIAGPALVIPYDIVHTTKAGEEYVSRYHLYLLPETLDIEADVAADIRRRGIYDVPVYTATMRLRGAFPKPDFTTLKITDSAVDWDNAYVALSVSDGRAIAELPGVTFAGKELRFEPGGEPVKGLPPTIVAPLGTILHTAGRGTAPSFDIELRVNGSESLRFLPAGDTTRLTMRSTWPSPSFSGNYLPEQHDVRADGFTASWKVSSIGRVMPSRWTDAVAATGMAELSAFGVDLYSPISVYRLTERAAKYGILFIGLSFVSYFLFEIVAGLRLHPLQYLLVGLANCLFYLLLLSLAEHAGFGWAYLASGLASCALIVGYSQSVLGDRRRTMIMAAVLGLLYGFLYLTLKAETYAMLAGALGLWAVLAIVMYLTRRIDWYGERDVPR